MQHARGLKWIDLLSQWIWIMGILMILESSRYYLGRDCMSRLRGCPQVEREHVFLNPSSSFYLSSIYRDGTFPDPMLVAFLELISRASRRSPPPFPTHDGIPTLCCQSLWFFVLEIRQCRTPVLNRPTAPQPRPISCSHEDPLHQHRTQLSLTEASSGPLSSSLRHGRICPL